MATGCYEIALKECRRAWNSHGLGTPSDAQVEEVMDAVVIAVRRTGAIVPLYYAQKAARNRASRLAQKTKVQEKRMKHLQAEAVRLQSVMPSVESLVEARLRLCHVASLGSALPPNDKAVLLRLVDGETTSADRNDIRRIRGILRG